MRPIGGTPNFQPMNQAASQAAGQHSPLKPAQGATQMLSPGVLASPPVAARPGKSAGASAFDWVKDTASKTWDGIKTVGKLAVQVAANLPKPKKDIQLNVPFIHQFEDGKGFESGNEACFQAAKAMCRDSGVRVAGSNKRIQVATRQNKQGRITIDPKAAKKGVAYIDKELEAGRPVQVGVSYSGHKSKNVDKITDHFVTITGRKTGKDGRMYYTFHDPSTGNKARGSDANPGNRLYLDPATGKLSKPAQPERKGVRVYQYDVSMVRMSVESLKESKKK